MSDKTSQASINAVLLKACDTFRGILNPTDYKNYVLIMLFLKYVTDVWEDHYDKLEKECKGDKARLQRRLRRERFYLPDGCHFQDLYKKRNEPNLGELINIALDKIESENKAKLDGVFRNVDFNSEAFLGQTKDRNERLKTLLSDFNHPDLNLRPSRIGNQDVIGNAYEFLIGSFAANAGQRAGEFYTPAEVSELLAELVAPKSGERICDPTCGSGSLLLKCASKLLAKGINDFALYGQELNGQTWALAKMNMLLHNVDSSRIEWGDTLRSPKLIERNTTMKFEVVVANPPFSLDKWGEAEAGADRYNRFHRGLPPGTKGDFAFISHIVETLTDTGGRAAVVVPHGVLFRGSKEGVIRQKLVEEGLVEAVIGLPTGLFFGTGIPAAILVLRKRKKDNSTLFIDGSREFGEGRKQNFLRPEDIKKIVAAYKKKEAIDGYAYKASLEDIKAKDFNLSISRYVDGGEAEAVLDVKSEYEKLETLRTDRDAAERKLVGFMKELGYGS